MDWRDYYFAPRASRFLHHAYGMPMPMMFPRYGQMPMRGDSESDNMSPPNESRPKWLKRMQKAGIAGPMIPQPGNSHQAMILPPWAAPGWRPQGGYYNDPMRRIGRDMMRRGIADGSINDYS